MATKTFKREELEAMTVADLRTMCVYDLAIPGMTKKRKDVIIGAILAKYGTVSAGVTPKTEITKTTESLKGIEFEAKSVLTKPAEKFGYKTTTTVHVSCGASSGAFPVAGRTVKEVGEFLREVLNVDSLSTGLVNGVNVAADYIIKPGDNLEFLKPAGQKGC